METGLLLRDRRDVIFRELSQTVTKETGSSGISAEQPFWYCARTKPKHEHIASANLRKQLSLETFLPRLKMERATRRRASLKTVEPLFPCYLFVRCVMGESMNEIRHTNGISSLVRFGDKIPVVPDFIIEDLRKCFSDDETLAIENDFTPGEEIFVTGGAFAGMHAQVLRSFPAKRRVQILLEVLGRSTPVEVDRNFVVQTNHTLANLVPALAATPVMPVQESL